MKALSILLSVMILAFMALAFVLYTAPLGIVHATATTTVTGWLFPDGTHFNNAIGAILFPIVGVGIFVGIAKATGTEGDFGVTLILAGLTLGGVLAQLSVTASNTNILPVSLVVIPGIDLLLWVWKGGG